MSNRINSRGSARPTSTQGQKIRKKNTDREAEPPKKGPTTRSMGDIALALVAIETRDLAMQNISRGIKTIEHNRITVDPKFNKPIRARNAVPVSPERIKRQRDTELKEPSAKRRREESSAEENTEDYIIGENPDINAPDINPDIEIEPLHPDDQIPELDENQKKIENLEIEIQDLKDDLMNTGYELSIKETRLKEITNKLKNKEEEFEENIIELETELENTVAENSKLTRTFLALKNKYDLRVAYFNKLVNMYIREKENSAWYKHRSDQYQQLTTLFGRMAFQLCLELRNTKIVINDLYKQIAETADEDSKRMQRILRQFNDDIETLENDIAELEDSVIEAEQSQLEAENQADLSWYLAKASILASGTALLSQTGIQRSITSTITTQAARMLWSTGTTTFLSDITANALSLGLIFGSIGTVYYGYRALTSRPTVDLTKSQEEQ